MKAVVGNPMAAIQLITVAHLLLAPSSAGFHHFLVSCSILIGYDLAQSRGSSQASSY